MIKGFSSRNTKELIEKEFKMSNTTRTDWRNYVREVALAELLEQPPMGGVGQVVQIDECLMRGRRKANRGRLLTGDNVPPRRCNYGGVSDKGPWIFGMCVSTKELRLFEVDKRDAATLGPLIAKNVLPGTTVFSDEWAAYRCIPGLRTHLAMSGEGAKPEATVLPIRRASLSQQDVRQPVRHQVPATGNLSRPKVVPRPGSRVASIAKSFEQLSLAEGRTVTNRRSFRAASGIVRPSAVRRTHSVLTQQKPLTAVQVAVRNLEARCASPAKETPANHSFLWTRDNKELPYGGSLSSASGDASKSNSQWSMPESDKPYEDITWEMEAAGKGSRRRPLATFYVQLSLDSAATTTTTGVIFGLKACHSIQVCLQDSSKQSVFLTAQACAYGRMTPPPWERLRMQPALCQI
ncbi:hypothetical protein HPB52_004870 [Rhipicephalus sanguineus]|uniref:ISXO2-like transposase domain-containing protein n=1 Tax=Rhipicephalus sanguineus TaxID=34632 RepID=A0A9D4SWB6_RHISA|nr:hypothetical protein HPB52_004870 [Rhipicephalus sanguineus]